MEPALFPRVGRSSPSVNDQRSVQRGGGQTQSEPEAVCRFGLTLHLRKMPFENHPRSGYIRE